MMKNRQIEIKISPIRLFFYFFFINRQNATNFDKATWYYMPQNLSFPPLLWIILKFWLGGEEKMDLESYEINKDTCAVINVGSEASQIIEKKKEYLLPKKTFEVMEDSCAYYGSTFDGRLKGTKMILGANYKLPIIIEETNNIIFFPTTGSNNDCCSWISLKHVKKYESYKGYTRVTFNEGKTIILKMSCSSFETQLFRAMRLREILNERAEKTVEDEKTPRKKKTTTKKTITK